MLDDITPSTISHLAINPKTHSIVTSLSTPKTHSIVNPNLIHLLLSLSTLMTSSALIVTFAYMMCNSSRSRANILQGSIPTGQKFRKFLIQDYGFLPENIKMITNETEPTPPKAYVVRKLCKCVSKLKRGDRFVYLFIGMEIDKLFSTRTLQVM